MGYRAGVSEPRKLRVRDLGPIRSADIDLGDLTVLVGPQASGKSVVLQLLKAIVDIDAVVEALKLHGFHFKSREDFVELMFGEGMRGLVGPKTEIEVDGQAWDFKEAADAAWSKRGRQGPRLFYVPAQRVLTIQEGWPRPFTAFPSDTPFVVKQFSEDIRRLLEEMEESQVFPAFRWKKEIRDLVAASVFHGAKVNVDRERVRKRLILDFGPHQIPFLSWSAGQREFIPLMLGLYWLTPAQATPRRQHLEWAVIEEPEMGLHPAAIDAVSLLMLDLLKRGYRVVLSTHSPHLLELVWALTRVQQRLAERPEMIARLFKLEAGAGLKEIGRSLAKKRMVVHHLGHTPAGVYSKDISSLDPASLDPDVAGWGGLTDFAERAEGLVREGLLF